MTDVAELCVADVVRELGLSISASGDRLDAVVTGAQVSDLLSYVMAEGKNGNLWITIQTHPNIIAVGELAGLSGIIVVGGLEPEPETVTRAEEEGVALLTSPKSSFVIAGQLHELGVR